MKILNFISLTLLLFSLSHCDINDDANDVCFSPTQNIDIAYKEGSIGCSCDKNVDEDICVDGAALMCKVDRWVAVEDGPCMPLPPQLE